MTLYAEQKKLKTLSQRKHQAETASQMNSTKQLRGKNTYQLYTNSFRKLKRREYVPIHL